MTAVKQNMLKTLGLLLFSPDAVEADLVSPILRRLISQENIKPMQIRFLQMTPARLEGLYGHQLGRMAPNWWLVQELFALGRSVAVLLSGDPLDQPSLSSRLKNLKGRSDPSLCASHTLRGAFEAKNGLINLIHTPDDLEEFSREGALFFSEEEMTRAFHAQKNQHSLPIADLLEENFKPPQLIGFFEILLRVKCRLTLLAYQSSPETVSNDFITHLLLEKNHLIQQKTRAIRTPEYETLLTEQHQAWASQTSLCQNRLTKLLDRLVKLPFTGKIDIYDEFQALQHELGPILTSWELLIIQSSAAAPSSIYFHTDILI